ncbi:MAG: hypothetical protein K8S99_12690 [Planctomycetes bacterium]|nr:hypothetical protein [Planctomycetota bacterium]
MSRHRLLIAVGVALSLVAPCMAADAPKAKEPDKKAPLASPFDARDPEIQAVRKLKFDDIDMKKVDLKERVAAMMALNSLLGKHGEKATRRVAYLNEYMRTNNLEADYTAYATPVPDLDLLTYDTAMKIAVALVRTPDGAATYGEKVKSLDEATLNNMSSWFDKECRARWYDVVFKRHQIASLCEYLEKKGKFSDFVTWAMAKLAAAEEQKKQELAAKREQAAADAKARQAEMKVRQAEAKAAREQREREEDEREMKRLDYAVQLEKERIAADRDIKVSENQKYNYYNW